MNTRSRPYSLTDPVTIDPVYSVRVESVMFIKGLRYNSFLLFLTVDFSTFLHHRYVSKGLPFLVYLHKGRRYPPGLNRLFPEGLCVSVLVTSKGLRLGPWTLL